MIVKISNKISTNEVEVGELYRMIHVSLLYKGVSLSAVSQRHLSFRPDI